MAASLKCRPLRRSTRASCWWWRSPMPPDLALPIRSGGAKAMIAETRVGALLAGYRGRPLGDVPVLARCLTAIADFRLGRARRLPRDRRQPNRCARAERGLRRDRRPRWPAARHGSLTAG